MDGSNRRLTATHAVATVVTEIAVTISDRDAAAVITGRSIDLESGKLLGRSMVLRFGFAVTVGVPVAAGRGDFAEAGQ